MRLATIAVAASLLCAAGCKWAASQIAAAIRHVTRYEDGTPRKEGTLVDGLQSGKWTFYYPDQRKRSEGDYRDDVQVGAWTAWYENGHVEWQGTFDDAGGRTGSWTFHHPDGSLRAAGRFARDFEQGYWTFHGPGGALVRAGDFLDARQCGWWRYREASGTEAGLVHDGTRIGPWTGAGGDAAATVHPVPAAFVLVRENWPDGGLRRTGLLRDGRPSGGWASFHPDGALRATATFEDGGARSVAVFDRAGGLAAAGLLNGNDLDGWRLADGPGEQERTPLPQLPPGEAGWPAEETAAAAAPAALIASRLAELRSPVPASAHVAAPTAAEGTPPVALASPRIPASRQPEWTVLESERIDEFVQDFRDGRPDGAPRPSHRRYSVPAEMVGKPRRRDDIEGRPLPIEELVATDGQRVALADYRGNKRVLLVVLRGFFGQVCVYCVAQTEALAQCQERFDELGLEVLILYPGPAGNEEAFLAAYEESFGKGAPPYRVFYDADLSIVQRLGIEGGDLAYPTTLFVDEQGIVRYAYTGAHRADRPAAKELIRFVESLEPR